VQRALLEIGKPYDLINYNCESFSNYVQYQRVESNQAEVGMAIFGLAAVIMLANRLYN
jgi:hypothetical protein